MAQPATNSPLIVISYHSEDEHWSERLISQLGPAAEEYGVWFDRVDNQRSGRVDEGTATALKTAKVLVILISPSYLGLTWVGSYVTPHFPSEGSSTFGLLVQQTSREQLYVLPSSYIPLNTTPLSGANPSLASAILAKLVTLIGVLIEGESISSASENKDALLTVDNLSKFTKSEEVEDAFRRAQRLAMASKVKPPVVTTSCLLFGLAEAGRPEVEYLRTPQFLLRELTRRGEETYKHALLNAFPELDDLVYGINALSAEAKAITPNVIELFELAQRLAQQTLHDTDPVISARHLLAALLVLDPEEGPTGAGWRLTRIVSSIAHLRSRFYTFIVRSLPEDDHEAWKSILLDHELPKWSPQDQIQDSTTEGVVRPTVAGFMADEWTGRDLLGITRDVNALASLVAAYKIEPPLSIGLFGDWGSGKSHFMRQMRKRVELLSQLARNYDKPQNELGYYKNIVQIEFNAWHYIEGNLWASLVDHIFANLRLSEKEPRSFAEERRDELMQKLGVRQEIQAKISSKVQECEDELRKLNERKEQAEADLNEASTQLEGFRDEVKANLKTLSVQVDFTDEERELLNRLGIETSSTMTAADVRASYVRIRHGWNSLKACWSLLRTDPRVGRRYYLSALLALIPLAAALLVNFKNIPRLPTILVSSLGFLATLYVTAKPAWEQFQKSLKALEKHDQDVERERQKRITQLENEISALTKEVVAAKLEGETVGKEIQKLKADIANTNSSKILAQFIEDRAAATDYRRHLGLLALIRRDFEKLRDLFDQQRKEASEGTERSDQRKIDRIVLYIDDLDRCPPDRVVQVLQAIHLLLAFPLFVVVVGVDSRWITRSLEQSYEWLREVDEVESDSQKANVIAQRDGSNSSKTGATPHDYLEKIFQIPFWLNCMNDTACTDFLDGLTKEAMDNGLPQLKPSDEQNAHKPEPTEPVIAKAAVVEVPAPIPVPSVEEPLILEIEDGVRGTAPQTLQTLPIPSVVPSIGENYTGNEIDLAPRSLTFTSFEVDYMKKLVSLIGRSPRAVKRFLNCYRLIKVGLTPAEFDGFVGEKGEGRGYRATMVLLGIIIGTPMVSSYVMDELWESKTLAFEAWVNAVTGNADMQRQAEGARLTNFLKIHDFGTSSDLLLREMVYYAPRVSRFSFGANWDDAR